jgi:hypothetical protein
MLKEILSIFKSNSLNRVNLISQIAANVIGAFEKEYAQDHNAKDAAIDTLVALLQSHKSTAVPAVPAEPAKPAS